MMIVLYMHNGLCICPASNVIHSLQAYLSMALNREMCLFVCSVAYQQVMMLF